MNDDKEILERMRELDSVMHESLFSLRNCELSQRRVAEVVTIIVDAYVRLEERVKAIEEKIGKAVEYQQEQNER